MATLSPPTSPHAHEHRPRAVTSGSYMSTRSRRSSHSANKLELIESARDKKKLETRNDPRAALNEAQPADIALQESSLDNLRTMQHKDDGGNVITDPDRSNPTRYRLERPLQTIMGFHEAAEGTSNRRSSYQRPSPGVDNSQRRSSYYGTGYGTPAQRPRPGPGNGGYYRNSSYGFRNDSSVPEDGLAQPPYGRPPRHPSQPYYGNNDSPASGSSYQQYNDAATSGSDGLGNSTGPSSQNSSFDRLHQMPMRKPDEFGEQYGGNGQYPPPPPPQHAMRGHPPNGAMGGEYNQQQFRAGPPAPVNNPRQPIKLNTANSGPPPTSADLQRARPEKRQSWIKRRFSRRDS